MTPELAHAVYREVVRLATHPGWGPSEKVLALADLQERLFVEVTKAEQLTFSTLFARISYVGHKHRLSAEALRVIHYFRRTAARIRAGQRSVSSHDAALGVWALVEAVRGLSGQPAPAAVEALLPAAGEWAFEAVGIAAHRAQARVVVVENVPEERCLLAYDEERPEALIRVRYHLSDRNENFTPTIQLLQKAFPLPVTVNLIDVDIDQAGDYRPRAFVVEPDYLVDVTHVAERFLPDRVEPMGFLVKKFLPYEMSAAALVGNIANYFLDRLMNEPDAEFASLIRETFALYPLVYAPMSDQEAKDVVNRAQLHYTNLKVMAQTGFRQQGIEPAHCVLEPTFYSQKYGLQGRLDLFYRDGERAAIVELKSGQPFRPNAYGISRSHFTQTLLYDLLARSVFGATIDPAKYILYSGVETQHLRFGPTVEPEQWEALQVRNQLVAIERLLTGIRPGQLQVPLFERLRKMAEAAPDTNDFTLKEVAQFAAVYSALNAVERKYFNAFAGFIAREHWQAKVGAEGTDAFGGSAALWRNSLADKQDAFAILAQMELIENRANQAEPTIVFRRTEKTNPLANFRVGDLAVLYPADDEAATVLQHQVIKCTIVELGARHVTVQLRARQFNLKPFEAHRRWNLEPDSLEGGFSSLYRSLYEWAKAPPLIRARWLCPTAADEKAAPAEENLSAEYIATAPHFFLLWGPPGTGKTSIMLRDIVRWVLHNTQDNLVLLAYTNRAVDEMCEVLEALEIDYIRIGAPFATGERFRDRLLSQRIASATTRAELRAVLDPVRLFVSTASSFAQSDSLLKIKTFQRLIVDEASQILEPQLIGLLTRFQHVVLIGDHCQLPAVVAQEPEHTRVDDPDLNAIGLTDLRDSYFERLYRYCKQHGLHRHYGLLSRQGRMHADIMAFPSQHFYGGCLHTLPPPWGERQHLPLTGDPLGQRVCFLPVTSPNALPHQRVSAEEARWIALLTRYFRQQAERMGQPWNPERSVGIITPWRAQIAQIRQALAEVGLDPDELTIDTVERYQGGARDVILVSCCVHSKQQLHRLVSLSADGVDRKLNVALTRARERLIVVGNPKVLSEDPRYRAFIQQYALSVEQFQSADEQTFANFVSEINSSTPS
ncbi:MAG: AAA domain-containing protein [Saprospiraceae bacterium]|nr:AAA domain-containing protein [Saprospiraceae bacterium]MDW8228413.1 AAA domain-containing protein [Saprospiraceae bacterium]